MPFQPSRGIDRRDFVAAAVAIGGTGALSACLERERSAVTETPDGSTETDSGPAFPRGDPADVPSRQHAWNEYIVHDAHGNTVPPRQQLVLGLSYEGSTPPTDEEREQVEAALRGLERAHQWGTGGNTGAAFTRGLLFTLGYAPRYFERLGEVPDHLMTPEAVLKEVGEDPAKADGFDALLILTSDLGSVVLGAEAALFGERDTINGVDVEATFEGVFSKVARRTGIIGKGLPADKLDTDDIPEQAPLSMGFKSGFSDNQASEDAVTIEEGPFAGGTTQAVSRLHIDLDRWYEQSREARTEEMFCPAHTTEEVGETGEKLGSDSGIDESDVENIPEHAEEHGRVGHSAKVASARTDGFEARILRRSEGVATDVAEGAGFNFSGIQRTVEDFVETRKAMNVSEYDVDVADEHHGIVDYLETKARGTFLIPPREKRALPEV